MDELIATIGAGVYFPAFTKGKKQLSRNEVDSIRSIAIEIMERVIGAVRQKYTILESTILVNMVMMTESKVQPVLDKIVLMACASTYIRPFQEY